MTIARRELRAQRRCVSSTPRVRQLRGLPPNAINVYVDRRTCLIDAGHAAARCGGSAGRRRSLPLTRPRADARAPRPPGRVARDLHRARDPAVVRRGRRRRDGDAAAASRARSRRGSSTGCRTASGPGRRTRSRGGCARATRSRASTVLEVPGPLGGPRRVLARVRPRARRRRRAEQHGRAHGHPGAARAARPSSPPTRCATASRSAGSRRCEPSLDALRARRAAARLAQARAVRGESRLMRQLTSLDAQFLALESRQPHRPRRGPRDRRPVDRAGGASAATRIRELLRERLPLLPPFRWRLAEVPFGLDYPYWVDDPEFDLDYHVRELALPKPGSDAQLAAQVARIHSRPLDRSRPLWELYVIEGLESGHSAVLTKIHHAVIDGMSGAEIMGVLLDLVARRAARSTPPDDERRRRPPARPGRLEMLGRGLLGVPRYPLRALRGAPARDAEHRGHAVRDAARRGDDRRGSPAGRRRAPVSPRRRRRSTGASRRTGASRSGSCRSRTSSASRTTTAARSTTSSWRSARAPCGAG